MTSMWIKDFKTFYQWADKHSDPRTSNWLFVENVYHPLLLVLAYLTVVIVGPKMMENRKPFILQWPMALYNAAMALMNLYMFVELVLATIDAGYNYKCQPVSYGNDPKELRIANVLWWFYVSKMIEFLDTMFFILRKKNNQISFLHVYHHATMVMWWWIGMKWVAGGQSFFSALINSFVHVIMYGYYGLSVFPSLRKFLWWKKYLTQFQLLQFCIVFTHGFVSLQTQCDFPLWMQYACMGYMISFVVLFSNFYLHAYLTRKSRKHEENIELKKEKKTN